MRFTVTNEASEAMPVGFGLHPYFIRTPRAVLRADVGPMWQSDAELMPVRLTDGAAATPARRRRAQSRMPTPLDNNFIGFGGRAVIEWPEWSARLRMDADPIYACLVVYTPAGRDFFCVEPATNCVDAFNPRRRGPPRHRTHRPRTGRHGDRRRDVHTGRLVARVGPSCGLPITSFLLRDRSLMMDP